MHERSEAEFTDGELELVTEALSAAIEVLEDQPRRHFRVSARSRGYAWGKSRNARHDDDIWEDGDIEDLAKFRVEDPLVGHWVNHGRRMLERLLIERDHRRALTVERMCRWAEYGLPRSSQ